MQEGDWPAAASSQAFQASTFTSSSFPSAAPIESLPIELLTEIVSFVGPTIWHRRVCNEVNHLFRHVYQQPCFWRRFSPPKPHMAALVTRFGRGGTKFGDASVDSLLLNEGAAHLMYVELAPHPRVTDRGVEAIALRCAELREISLPVHRMDRPGKASEDCDEETPRTTDRSLFALADRCPKLEILVAAKVRGITSAGLVAVANGCPNLKILNAFRTRAMDASVYTALASNCKGLQQLRLAEAGFVRDECYELLAQNCHDLRELDFFRHPIGNTVIKALAQHCRKLQRLSVQRCNDLTEVEPIEQLLQNNQQLVAIELTHSRLADYMERLKDRYPHVSIW